MNVTPAGSPRPSHTARDYAAIRDDLRAFVAQTRPDLLPDFDNAEGLGPLLLDLAALVGDIGSFAVDEAARAVFPDTSLQYGVVLRFARSMGYVPRSANAASVAVVCDPLPAAVTANGATVAGGQSIPGPNGTSFYLPVEVTIPPGATDATFGLVEGVPYEESFEATNLPRATVRTANAVVAEGSWGVFVGDPTNPANEWAQVENVALETAATNTYEIRFDGVGRLEVRFGDGVAGKIPDQTVTVQYRTTRGAFGNVPMLSLAGTLNGIVTGPNTPVPLDVTNRDAAAADGAARETLAEMRVNIPAFMRSSGKLTTIRDFDAAPRNVPGVAASFADLSYASYQANIVNVNVWAEEPVTFTAEGTSPVARSATDYTRYKTASSALGTAVHAYMTERTAVTVFPRVLRPAVAWADLYVRALAYDPRFSAAAVHRGVTAAVVGVFEGGDGFSVRLADLYDAIRGVAGVRHFTIDRLVFEYTSKARATGYVELLGSAQPADGDTVTVNDGQTTTVFEFDGDADLNNGAAVPVPIGAGAFDTIENFIAAVNVRNLNVKAERDTGAVAPVALLRQTLGGAAYNLPLAKTGVVIAAVGMTGGSDAIATVREDRRQSTATDPWPPGTYAPGEPFVGSAPWADGGIVPYFPMGDVVVPIDRYAQRYYNEAQAYNHEIIYNASGSLAVVPQVVNLRRLVVNMVPASA